MPSRAGTSLRAANDTSARRLHGIVGSVTELAERLIAHYEELLNDRQPREHEDAWNDAGDLVRADADRGWALIAQVVERIPAAALTYLAAGPLEDLIDFHPDFAVARLEAEHPHVRLSTALREVVSGRGPIPPSFPGFVDLSLKSATRGTRSRLLAQTTRWERVRRSSS